MTAPQSPMAPYVEDVADRQPEDPVPAGTWTIGLNSQTLRAPVLLDRLDASQRAGFRLMELSGAELDPYIERPAPVVEALAGRSLQLLGVCPAPDLFAWHYAWDADLAQLLKARLRLYRALGAEYFVLPFMSERGDTEAAIRGLAGASKVAEETGIGLAIESIGHVPRFRRLEEVRALIETVGKDSVGVALDSFHFFRARHTLDDLTALEGLKVWVVQVSSAVDKSLDELVGYRDRTFPLDGVFDVVGFCRAVAPWAAGAPLVAEVMGDVPWALDADTCARRAHDHLTSLAATTSLGKSSWPSHRTY